jgi:hypothetical protein
VQILRRVDGSFAQLLPNCRSLLIVDACLRIGYTTILLGTLGYFGLGLAPESPRRTRQNRHRSPADPQPAAICRGAPPS